MGVRSFDAPRRAGTVTNQDSTAACRERGQAIVVGMRCPLGKWPGGEDGSSAVELPVLV
jgi:hypothetical protein